MFDFILLTSGYLNMHFMFSIS